MRAVDTLFWKRKNVLVTGHSGFMGTWLSELLLFLGAKVTGISLKRNDNWKFNQIVQDIRNAAAVSTQINSDRPDVIFHLAGISNIPCALNDPVGAFSINVGGTLNVLNAVREAGGVKSVVIITSDKCYKNTGETYKKETDELGGIDPYSASKAACEIAVHSFYETFLRNKTTIPTSVATVRVCNLVGGGDMTPGRLLPALAQGVNDNKTVELRSPNAIRPWLYVLDALSGYLFLAESMFVDSNKYSGGWNFGPNKSEVKTVEEITLSFYEHWGNGICQFVKKEALQNENNLLLLDTAKAVNILNWQPKVLFHDMMIRTVDFYKRQISGDVCKIYLEHIQMYFEKDRDS